MKKYTDAHLESVPPEYIAQLETFLNDDSIHHCSRCCMVNGEDEFGNRTYAVDCDVLGGYECPKHIEYEYLCHDICPCDHYGSFKKAKAAGMNLIRQWKQWAEL